MTRSRTEAHEAGVVVLTCDALKQLLCKILDMPPRKWLELVLPQKVVDAETQEFCDYADVVPVVEPLFQVDAFAAQRIERVRVGLVVDGFENLLQVCRIP